WPMIRVTEMLFRRHVAAGDGPGELQGLHGDEALERIQFKLPGWRWTPYLIIAFLAMVAVLMCFSPSYRIALIAGVIWLAVLFAAYAFTSKGDERRRKAAKER
ncbi:MAG: aromatic amino acid transporter AroP, partial [Bifidobacterium castoris]|nr:aromatic amino acid transporter AroP [Bifidobacterium castoris]